MHGILMLAITTTIWAGDPGKIKLHEPTGRVSLSGEADVATMKEIPGDARILFMLSAKKISPEGLKQLTRLQEVEFLRLNRNPHGDSALEALANHPKLRSLMMWSDTGITATGIRHLASVKPLRSLDFTNVPLDQPALKAMPTQVTSLTIQRCQIGDSGLAALPLFPKLKGIKVKYDDKVTDEGLIDFVNRHPQLEGLAVDVASDRLLATLEKLPNLKSLWLDGQPFTLKGLESIGRLQKLERLTISFDVTEELKTQIEKLPNEKLDHVSNQGKSIYLERKRQ